MNRSPVSTPHGPVRAIRGCPSQNDRFRRSETAGPLIDSSVNDMTMSPTVPASELRLMCVLAHPDDESLGTGGTLARYAAEGVATFLVTATRGERGRYHDGTAAGPGDRRAGRARQSCWPPPRELGLQRSPLSRLPRRRASTRSTAARRSPRSPGTFAG